MAHLARVPTAMASFAGNCMKHATLSNAYASHLEQKYPESSSQSWNTWKRVWVQEEKTNLVVADDLPMSRKDFSDMMVYSEDIDRMSHPLLVTAFTGGASLIGLPFWANATHKLPSTFFSGEGELREAGKARDQEVHIKHAPIAAYRLARHMEFFISGEPGFNDAFDSVADGFTAPKDPMAIRKMGQYINKVETSPLHFIAADVSSWNRASSLYEVSAFLGKGFWLHSQETLTAKVVTHYRMLLQEDVLIKKEGLESLSDFELYQVCNRRLIARWEEDLNRSQLEARLEDWLKMTEIKEGEEKCPITIMVLYQTAHFRDPGFLDDTLENLDVDAFPSAMNWAKDAFERRIEFESGPLANQVRAHFLKTTEEEAKMLADRQAYLSSKN